MTYALFLISLIGLCIASLAAFITAFRKRSWPLLIFAPLIAIAGSCIYFSYTSVLGYPVELTWEQLPARITVVFFKVEGKESISLWLIEGNTTRLVILPYIEPAENGLEGERGTMGQGTPVTFQAMGKKGKGQGQPGDGQGQGGEGADGADGAEGIGPLGVGGGWRYYVISKGDPIPGTALPPKNLAPQR